MSASQPYAAISGSFLNGEPFWDLARSSPRLAALVQELESIETRLGTDDEQPEDLERAQAIGHRIRNEACILVLRRDPQPVCGVA
jgi:hypothetical protein